MKNILFTSGLIFVLLIISFTGAVAADKKFIILGIDGMDYTVLSEMMERGEMPNFVKFRESGDFKPLLSSVPPQSPVAWSNFITGMDPGGHGIFDFIHRTPEDLLPYLSTSKTEAPSKVFSIGKYRIPLKSEEIKLLRKGKPFWDILEEHGIPTTIISIPANFPSIKSAGRSLSGMGTPDILGSYGSFTYLTSDPNDKGKKVTGGVIHPVEVRDNQVKSFIPGPPNSLVDGAPSSSVDVTTYVDPENSVAKIVVNGNDILLSKGEWSEFVRVEFEMIPHIVSVSGIVRFYLKDVHPYFKLYISPVNIDPSDPAMPISNPEDYAKELYKNIGFFYTQGISEDTKALDNGILSEDEFQQQAQVVLRDRLKILDYELKRFKKGLLFFYISTIDTSSHMFWRYIAKDHPDYNTEEYKKYRNVMFDLYKRMDVILADVLKRVDDNTVVMIMSDHGFADFQWQVNINSWLAKEGYIELLPDWKPEQEYFESVKWSGTKAYALGINGLYINLKGREKYGIVGPGEYKHLVDEIASKLEAMTDPKTGRRVIRQAFKKDETYHGSSMDIAPDIVVGFYRGYRSSDESALGQFSKEVIIENSRKWGSDHCIDYREVPGIVLLNKKITLREPALFDIAPTILKEFGIDPLPEMVGKSIY
ncbi:MAG: alkaline phosphatase family protein [Nitrospirae bacterium]|nr:alkaline phosphatase family protein [Nitrospirota bacterium]